MSDRPDPYVLLMRALGTLAEEEQGIVMRSLLTVFPASSPRVPISPQAAAAVRADPATALSVSTAFFRPEDADKVAFLLRLPAATHQALKSWADEHGHSMNVVVRGLVERFLADQAAAG